MDNTRFNTNSFSPVNIPGFSVQTGPQTYDEAVTKIALEVAHLIISKQHDYGTDNIMLAPGGPEKGITVRMWDKMARIKHLVWDRDNKSQHESIDDSYKDIAGYAIIALMVRRKYFKLPLKVDTEKDAR